MSDDGATGDDTATAAADLRQNTPPPVSPSSSSSSSPSPSPLPSDPAATANTLDLLSRVQMFEGLRPAYVRRIAELGARERHPAGATIFSEGAAGDKMYLVLSGAVRIGRQLSGMGEEALAVLRPGDYFGEMALIDDSPRSADAKAHETTELFVIGKEELADLLFVDRDLAYDLLWNLVRTLAGRLRDTNDKMTFLAVSNKF